MRPAVVLETDIFLLDVTGLRATAATGHDEARQRRDPGMTQPATGLESSLTSLVGGCGPMGAQWVETTGLDRAMAFFI